MRVLLVNDYEHKGGAEVVMHAQRAALAAVGHDVEVFAADAEGLTRSPLAYIDSHRARRLLRRRLLAFEPDVVHLHNFYHLLSPGVLGELVRWKRAGRVVAMTVHDMHIVCPNPGLLRFDGGGARLVDEGGAAGGARLFRTRWDESGWGRSLLRAGQHWWNYRVHDRRSAIDVLVAPSRWALERVGGLGRPVRRVPNPIDLDGPALAGSDRGLNAGWTIAYAGRVEPEKGLAEFIGALEGLPVRLRVIGDGSDVARCRAEAARAGVPAEFMGWVGQDRARRAIGDSDALVLPSRVQENAPLAVFEAIAARTVPIVTGVGGLPEIVEEFGIGHVFDRGDRESVRRAIWNAQTTAPGEDAWARAAALLAGRSSDRYARALESVYREFGCGS
ncbi:MAG: glycosyltransferase [Phycisphaerales bacterium]